jgi:hypothetical protein
MRELTIRRCCAGDEGRPLEAVWQEEAATPLKLLWSRVRVVSVEEKAGQRVRQVWTKKTNAREPLRTCRKRRDAVKTGASRYPGRSLGGPCLRPRRRPA